VPSNSRSLTRYGRRTGIAALVGLATALSALGSVASAHAAALSPDSLGVNIRLKPVHSTLQPTDLSVGSANGMGTARYPINAGWNADQLFTLTASAHVRMTPQLGLPTTETPSAAAADMAQFITTFTQRYGPSGSFWAANPQLPYLPVEQFEIGNEPNMPLRWVDDSNHLHWADPSAYAQVYAASRAALHAVDAGGVAVVGGLGDSASYGVDVQQDEQWLSALDPSAVDAVAYHPYTYQVSNSLMKPDTAALREWMNANGFTAAPLDINEFDNCEITPAKINASECRVSTTSAQWGQIAADYTQWALCNPSLNVATVQPFYWGSTADTDGDTWMTMMTGEGTLTPYGQDYLGLTHQLTTSGCPNLAPHSMSGPTIQGTPANGLRLTSKTGFWTGNPQPAFSYQWQRCNAAGQSCANIAGANSASYAVQAADSGSSIRVAVTGTNAAGASTALSQPTGAVPGSPPAPASSSKTTTSPGTTTSGSAGSGKAGGASTSQPGKPGSGTSGKGDSASTGGNSGGAGASGSPATTASVKAAKRRLAAIRLRIVRVGRKRHHLEIVVRAGVGCRNVQVIAYGPRHHRVKLRVNHRYRNHALIDLTARLGSGRWKVTVSARAARGYAVPKRLNRRLRIRG
jgi:hypothetical protein